MNGRTDSTACATTVAASTRAFFRDLTGRDPRDIEQIVDESHKVMELTSVDVVCGFPVMVGQARQTEQAEGVAEGRERVPELVREHGKELVLASVGFAQCVFGAVSSR